MRESVPGVRGAITTPPPVMRGAAAPAGHGQTDWGHGGASAAGDPQRKRAGLAVLACPRRLLSLACTHSQRQETLHRCLLPAVPVFQGPPHARVHDNRRTAVRERQGPRVRCHAPLWAFVRPWPLTPLAGTVAQPQDQGTVAQGAIPSSRHHCWPLRTFRPRTALQTPATQGRDEGATGSVHATTGQQPAQRGAPPAMRPFPARVPDGRDRAWATV